METTDYVHHRTPKFLSINNGPLASIGNLLALLPFESGTNVSVIGLSIGMLKCIDDISKSNETLRFKNVRFLFTFRKNLHVMLFYINILQW